MEEIDLESGEARVSTDITSQEAVRQAYADAVPQMDNDFTGNPHSTRCLTFLAPEWSEPEEAIRLVQYIGEYNNFYPSKVSKKIRQVVEETEHVRIAIGREGSPVLYFEVSDIDPLSEEFAGYADEFMDCEAPDISQKSRYREEENRVDEHDMCLHDHPPIEPGDEADGDPDSDYQYIRCWWD